MNCHGIPKGISPLRFIHFATLVHSASLEMTMMGAGHRRDACATESNPKLSAIFFVNLQEFAGFLFILSPFKP